MYSCVYTCVRISVAFSFAGSSGILSTGVNMTGFIAGALTQTVISGAGSANNFLNGFPVDCSGFVVC